MNNSFLEGFHYHKAALAVFVVLATLFLWDVLFLGYSLGAFDIILSQTSWKGEFWYAGIHQPILSDSPTAHYPQREFDWGHVRQFSNADFNPYMFTGMPWSPQGVGGFITSFPQLFLDIKDAIDWSTWVRLICAGFFMYLLLLELGLSRLAGVFAGVLWTYSLHQVVWLEFPQHLATQLWIPLVYLLNLRILRNGLEAASAVALLIVNVLFFTSGYMQIVLYTYVSIGVFNTVYVMIHVRQTGIKRAIGMWGGVHGIYIAAVLLCAVGLYAEAQYISEGLRGAQDWRGRVDTPELDPGSLLGLVLSFFPRFSEVTQVLTPDYHGGIWSARYEFQRGNIVENSRYFGFLGLAFAVTALFAARRTGHVRIVATFAVVMALLFSMLYRNEFTISALGLIPFADKGSYSRFITLLTFCACVLAGYGLQYILGRQYKWVLVSLVVVGSYVAAAWYQMDEFAIRKLWYPALLAAVLVAALSARKVFDVDWRWMGVAVVALSVVDLFAAGYGFNTRMENERLFPRNNAIRYLLNDPEPYRVAVISERPLYHPNILSYYDIPVAEGYLTVLPVDYAEYIKELFPKAHITRNGILFLLKPDVEALRLMNVKYILSDQDLARKHDGLEHAIDSNNHFIFKVRNHLPRIFCASDVFFVEREKQQLDVYGDKLGKFDVPVVVTGREKHEEYAGTCRIDGMEVYTLGLSADLETDRARYLVLPYAFNENWTLSINGEPAQPLKANGYHMAVEIPSGQLRLELLYRNRFNEWSAWILILASLGVLIFIWRNTAGGGILRLGLTVAAAAIIFKSSLSLPMVKNTRVLERAPVSEPLEVVRQGAQRDEREVLSERIYKDNPLELPLDVDSRGLTRISLLAGTFHQSSLKQTVKVEILDESGKALVAKEVAGRNISNNGWFSIDFPPIQRDTGLSVRVSTEEDRPERSFILWLDKEGRICVQSFYTFET